MKKNLKIAIISASAILVFVLGYWIFSKLNKLDFLQYVPDKSIAVAKINPSAFASAIKKDGKLDVEEEKMQIFLSSMESSLGTFKKIFKFMIENPEEAGLDFSVSPVFFIEKTEKSLNKGLFLALKSEGKIKEAVHEHAPIGSEILDFDGVSYVELGQANYMAWKNGKLLIVSQKGEERKYFYKLLTDKPVHEKIIPYLNTIENSKAPISMFFNNDKMLSMLGGLMGEDAGIIGLNFLEDFAKSPNGLISVLDMNFEKGKVTLSRKYFHEKPEKIKATIFTRNVSAFSQFQNSIPYNENLALAGYANLDKEKLLAKLKEENGGAFSNEDEKAIWEAVTGNLYFQLVKKDNVTDTGKWSEKFNGDILLHVGINNASAIRNLIEGEMSNEDGLYSSLLPLRKGLNVYVAIQDNVVSIGTNKELMLKVLQGKSVGDKNISQNKNISTSMKSKAAFGFLNVKHFVNIVSDELYSLNSKKDLARFMSKFNTNLSYESLGAEDLFNLEFADKEKNGFVQLVELMATFAEYSEKANELKKKSWESNSYERESDWID